MNASDPRTFSKIQSSNNASQERTMQGHTQQQKVGQRGGQRGGREQYAVRPQQPGSAGNYGPRPGRTSSAPPNAGAGDSAQMPQAFYPVAYGQGQAYMPNMYYQQQQFMMNPAVQQGGVPANGQVIPPGQQRNPKQAQGAQGQAPKPTADQQPKLPNGQPMGAGVPPYMQGAGFPRGSMPPMGNMAMYSPYQVPMYPPQYQYPMPASQQQRPASNVTQRREKKVLEIIDPKTKEAIVPSKQSAANGSKEGAVEGQAKAAAATAQKGKAEKPEEENQSKEMNAAPVQDARAELLASAKRALESDKTAREKAAEGKKGVAEKPRVEVAVKPVKPALESPENAKKTPSIVQKAAGIPTEAQQKKELEEKARAREEEERKERKAREEEAQRLLVAKANKASAAKEEFAKEQERMKAEIEAKKKMEEKKQALEKFKREANSEKVSALGNKMVQPSDVKVPSPPIVAPSTRSSSGKTTYAVEVLLQFRDKFTDVPQALSPSVIDMTNIIKKAQQSMGRSQFSSPREGRHSRHQQQPVQRQSAGGQWQRRGPRGHGDPRGGRAAPRPAANMGLKVDPLKKTANAWKRQKATSGEEVALRKVTQILNKLSRENFEKLVVQILEINITSLSMLESVVELIRNKALTEPKFGDLYADLCFALKEKTESSRYKAWSFIQILERDGQFYWTTSDDPEAEGYAEGPYETREIAEKTATKRSELRRILLGQCQEEFEKENHYEELERSKGQLMEKLKDCKTEEEKQKMQAEIAEIDYKTSRLKQRILGNIQFIGELFKKGILTVRVLTWCISNLLNQDESGSTKVPDAESLECLCKLLTTVGEVFESKSDPTFLNNFFDLLRDFSNDKKLANRHRFMIKDVIDLRANKWKARRKETKAKKLEEIRKDVEKEQAAKKAESAAHSRIPSKFQHRGGKPKTARGEVIRSVATGSSMMSGGYKIGAGSHHTGSQDVRQQPGPARSGSMRLSAPRPSNFGNKSNLGGAASGRPGGGRPTSFRPGGTGNGSSFAMKRPVRARGGPGGGPGGAASTSNAPPAAPAKPKAPALDESEMKRLIRNTLKEYGQVRMKTELLEYLESLIPKVGLARKLKNGVVDCCLEFVAEGSTKDREATTEAMVVLFEKKFLSEDNIKAAMPPFLEFVPDVKIDAPLADKHLGSLLAALINAKAVDVSRVPEFLIIPKGVMEDQVPSIKACVVTIAAVMLAGIMNNAEAAGLVKSKNLTLKQLVGSAIDDADVQETIEKYKLGSLFGAAPESRQDGGSEKAVQDLITKDSNVDEILRWIQVNVKDAELQSKEFAKAVVVSALEHLETTKGVLSNPSKLSADPPEALVQKEAEAIKEYSRLMKRVTSNDSGGKVQLEIQVECLEGVAELAQKYNFPPGLVKRLFKELYDAEVIKEEAYIAWKNVSKPSKAHETALLKCSEWLHWLETAEEESM